jgi:MFS family permease
VSPTTRPAGSTAAGRARAWARRREDPTSPSTLRLAGATGGLAQSLAGAAAPLLALRLAGTDAVTGLPQALLVTGSAGAAVGLSGLTTRWGRRWGLATGLLTETLGCLLVTVSAAGSLPVMLTGCLLLGAGNTAVMLARYAAADLVRQDLRAQAMAALLTATTLGAAAGPNLLALTNDAGTRIGLAPLAGAFIVAAAAFATAALTIVIGPPAHPAAGPPEGPTPASEGPAPRPAGPLAETRRQTRSGLLVLAVATLVMIAVMTMAPVHLHHLGHGLGAIGIVTSLHIGAMFAPSALSARLVDRVGPKPSAAGASMILVVACVLAATGAHSLAGLTVAMVTLGLGWNLALVSGSVLLTAGIPATARPRAEGRGEVGMNLAAAAGGVIAGPLVATNGYPTLAWAGAAIAGLLPLTLHHPTRRPGRPIK